MYKEWIQRRLICGTGEKNDELSDFFPVGFSTVRSVVLVIVGSFFFISPVYDAFSLGE